MKKLRITQVHNDIARKSRILLKSISKLSDAHHTYPNVHGINMGLKKKASLMFISLSILLHGTFAEVENP